MAHETPAYWPSHPRLRAFYMPPPASWLNRAELLLRAFSDQYLWRFDPQARHHVIDHRHASGREYNRR